MKKRFYLSWILQMFFVGNILLAQVPYGYYTAAIGKKKEALKTAMKNIITSGHNRNEYADLWNYFESTDKKPDGYYYDMYAGCSFNYYSSHTSSLTECSGFNREHSFPKSWFGGVEGTFMYADLFHLYPVDGHSNTMRSNYPFGEVYTATFTSNNGSKLGACKASIGYSGTVFEPIDEYKGDLARTYFYMLTRYEDESTTWNYGCEMINQTKFPGFKTWALNMLLDWARRDPVSDKEEERNNAIYKIQHNRNPFIDNPQLAEYVWGTKTTESFSVDGNLSPSVYVTNISFPTIEKGSATTQNLSLIAANLSSDLTLSLSGDYFTTTISKVSKDAASAGFSVPVVYAPTVSGTHTATLTISGGGLTSDAVFTISGNATGDISVCSLSQGNPVAGITEDFTTKRLSALTEWSRISVKGTDVSWVDKSYSGDNYAYVTAYKASGTNYEIWLLSPALDWDKMNNKTLTFRSAVSYYSINSDLKVYLLKCINGETEKTELNAVFPTATSTNYAWISSGNIDLSSQQGIGFIGFCYKASSNSSCGNYQIDNINVGDVTSGMAIVSSEVKACINNGVVSFRNVEESALVEVFNSYGTLAYKQTGSEQIPLHSKGLYIIRIIQAGKESVCKVLYL